MGEDQVSCTINKVSKASVTPKPNPLTLHYVPVRKSQTTPEDHNENKQD